MVALQTSRCLSALRTGSSEATTSQTMTPSLGCPTPFSPWFSSWEYPLSSSQPSTSQFTDTSRNTGQSSLRIGHRQKQNLDPVLIVLTSKQGLPKLARLAKIYPPPSFLHHEAITTTIRIGSKFCFC